MANSQDVLMEICCMELSDGKTVSPGGCKSTVVSPGCVLRRVGAGESTEDSSLKEVLVDKRSLAKGGDLATKRDLAEKSKFR